MDDTDSHYTSQQGVDPLRIRGYRNRKRPVDKLPRPAEVHLGPAARADATGPSYDDVIRRAEPWVETSNEQGGAVDTSV